MKTQEKVSKRDFEWNSCIQIEEARISRRVTIPHRVYFKLTPKVISQIENLRDRKQKVELEPETLANLRYYALLNSGLHERQKNIYHQSSLTFCSCFKSHNSPQTTVIRSVINLKGQISQEIQQDLWQNPQLLFGVIDIHYWLIEEILRQLPLPTHNNTSLAIWVCWIPLAIALTILLWFLIPLSFLFKITIIIVSLLLLKIYLNCLIRKKIRFWLLKQLSNGIFSQKNSYRKIGFSLLTFVF